jgi:small subunit ribosomal protein S16
MLKIRLAKVGRKRDVSFRIVVSEARTKRDSKNVAVLGFYDPLTKPPTLKIKKEEYQAWINKGAQPSKAVLKLVEKK